MTVVAAGGCIVGAFLLSTLGTGEVASPDQSVVDPTNIPVPDAELTCSSWKESDDVRRSSLSLYVWRFMYAERTNFMQPIPPPIKSDADAIETYLDSACSSASARPASSLLLRAVHGADEGDLDLDQLPQE